MPARFPENVYGSSKYATSQAKANAKVLSLPIPARLPARLPARFSGNVYSSTEYAVGQADAMLPLVGD
ncbi:hypothetical protein, partial [Rickettsiella grylli]|uniref:hypothetical protein n=1 Tax=Rickettsiella grylli TaxID=59196 RepID=UPI003CC83685